MIVSRMYQHNPDRKGTSLIAVKFLLTRHQLTN